MEVGGTYTEEISRKHEKTNNPTEEREQKKRQWEKHQAAKHREQNTMAPTG